MNKTNEAFRSFLQVHFQRAQPGAKEENQAWVRHPAVPFLFATIRHQPSPMSLHGVPISLKYSVRTLDKTSTPAHDSEPGHPETQALSHISAELDLTSSTKLARPK
ncbi:hypothetical protein MMC21_004264 [Puttea exsequens]|nr:hypothetical protein [Puttea exsequens]